MYILFRECSNMCKVTIFAFVTLCVVLLANGFVDIQEYDDDIIESAHIKFEGLSNDSITVTNEFLTRRLRNAEDDECTCGPLTTHCFVLDSESSPFQKLCRCGVDRYVLDGDCEDCDCANAICNAQKGTCRCNAGYGKSNLGRDCLACNCGTSENRCQFENGIQFCMCDNYLALNSTCLECACGPNEYCIFKDVLHECNCSANTPDLNEKCKDCDCDKGGDDCSFTESTKICKCLPGYSLKNGQCTECKCEENEHCEFLDGEEQCSCKEGYTEKNGTCEECDCGSGHACQFIDNKKNCICKENHIFYNATCTECSCEDGEICEIINEELTCICDHHYVEVNRVCIECFCGDGHSCEIINNRKVCVCEKGYVESNGTCQQCDCGEDHKCEIENGRKVCECLPGYADNNGTCEKCFCGDSTCFFESGIMVCFCGSGYAYVKGKCHETCQENSECLNGGSCIEDDKAFICSCKTGTSGAFCERVDECRTKYKNCKDEFGDCVYDVELGKAYCKCGERQMVDITAHVCKGCFCGEDHSCMFKNGQKTCICAANFVEQGGMCHEICDEITCHWGKCTKSENAAFCSCDEGFIGASCDQKVIITNGAIYMISALSAVTLFWTIFMAVFIIRRRRRHKSEFSRIEDDMYTYASVPGERETEM